MRNRSVQRLLEEIQSADEAQSRNSLESLWRSLSSMRRLKSRDKRLVISRVGRVLRFHTSPQVRADAAYALMVAGMLRRAPDPRPLLLQALMHDPDPSVRAQAAEGLGSLSQYRKPTPFLDRLGSELARGLRDQAAEVRFWCLYAVGVMKRGEHREAVAQLVGDTATIPGWWSVGEEAADVLRVLDGHAWPDRDRHGGARA